MPINGWMVKDVVGYYSAIKKEWCNAIYNDMEESKDCHIEWSRSDRKRQTSCNITYMWHLKKRTYLQNRGRVTGVEKKLMVTNWERSVGGINWETGTDIYTLLYIK